MVVQKLLLAYNFTSNDQKALDFVARTFSPHKELEVTLFHAYTPVPEIKAEDSSVMGRLRGNLSYLTQKIAEKENAMKEAVEELSNRGFGGDRARYVFKARRKDIAAEIIDQAAGGNFQVVVLRRKPGQVARFFATSVHSKVIAGLKGTTVCVVS